MSELTKEQLRYLYCEELLTDAEIASEFDTYQVKVSRLRRKFGIETLTKSERRASQLPEPTEKQRELVLGSLLGDGWMVRTSDASASFNETHCVEQRGYLEWKASLLEPFTSRIYETTKREGEVTYEGCGMATYSLPWLSEYETLFYGDGSKQFPVEIVERLTPFALAVWYMDDGGLMSKFHPRISFGLDNTSRGHCLSALRELGFKPTIHECSDGTTSIHFPGQSRSFYGCIREHIPDCMSYKLPVESERRLNDHNARKLTPEKARTLYDGNMTLNDIAGLYGVGRSTVHRRLHDGGRPKRMGRPREEYSVEAAAVALRNFDVSRWSELTEDDQQRWVDEVVEILIKTPFPFPKKFEGDEAAQIFEKLKAKELYLNAKREVRPRSYIGNKLCYGYFPNRYKATYRSKKSAWEAWHIQTDLRRAVEFQFRMGDPVVPRRVLKALTMQYRTPTVFRAATAKFVCEKWGEPQGVQWDPCAGYGGRMLGALSSGMSYVGTDVEPETVRGNRQLARTLGLSDQVELVCSPAEEFTPPNDIDLVFTSPPYFDTERYSHSKNQSWVRHGESLPSWTEGFLAPICRTAYDRLKPHGRLVINIADVTRKGVEIPLVEVTIETAKTVGFELEDQVIMPLASLNKKDAGEPILVFRR